MSQDVETVTATVVEPPYSGVRPSDKEPFTCLPVELQTGGRAKVYRDGANDPGMMKLTVGSVVALDVDRHFEKPRYGLLEDPPEMAEPDALGAWIEEQAALYGRCFGAALSVLERPLSALDAEPLYERVADAAGHIFEEAVLHHGSRPAATPAR